MLHPTMTTEKSITIPTALAGKILQSVASDCLFPLQLLNQLTLDLDFLHMYAHTTHTHTRLTAPFPGLPG